MSASPDLTTVAGHKILFAMATTQEYGPALKRLFTPLMTGVGPVEAAASVAVALARCEAGGTLPDLFVSLGSAGSQTLNHAGVYQATSVSYRDMDASPLGFEKGVVPFADFPATLELPLRIPGVATASLSTGANIVSGDAYRAIDADMVDMETYAVVRAAARFGVPVVGLRGISDGRGDLTGLHDWTEYLHVIDERLAEAVEALLEFFESGARSAGSGD